MEVISRETIDTLGRVMPRLEAEIWICLKSIQPYML